MTRPPAQPYAVHETDRPIECWEDREKSPVTWRTLVSADHAPTDSITAGVCDVPVGGGLERHRHAHAEVYYFLAGRGVVQVADAEFDVRAGSAVSIPGDTWHAIVNTAGGPLRLFYCFAADSFDEIQYVYP
jgi:mannose-6-phosphate isomerase-like protein (cupin superfamily)